MVFDLPGGCAAPCRRRLSISIQALPINALERESEHYFLTIFQVDYVDVLRGRILKL